MVVVVICDDMSRGVFCRILEMGEHVIALLLRLWWWLFTQKHLFFEIAE